MVEGQHAGEGGRERRGGEGEEKRVSLKAYVQERRVRCAIRL
jgi:hypothetical protein